MVRPCCFKDICVVRVRVRVCVCVCLCVYAFAEKRDGRGKERRVGTVERETSAELLGVLEVGGVCSASSQA